VTFLPNEKVDLLVIAGTSDARLVIEALVQKGARVLASVATEWGADLLADSGAVVVSGRRNTDAFIALMEQYNILRVLDCSHPYAVEVSKNVRQACKTLRLVYKRFDRSSELVGDQAVIRVSNREEAAQVVTSRLDRHAPEAKIFLTTGSKDLAFYAEAFDKDRLIARVIPTNRSLELCFDAGIRPDHIVAMQGPFNEELNVALFRHYRTGIVITKDSGAPGGYLEKITAAHKVGADCVVIARPSEETGEDEHMTKIEEVLRWFNIEMMG
jgi:precorrin-6A/cobalt-precorrin-6A reductase